MQQEIKTFISGTSTDDGHHIFLIDKSKDYEKIQRHKKSFKSKFYLSNKIIQLELRHRTITPTFIVIGVTFK